MCVRLEGHGSSTWRQEYEVSTGGPNKSDDHRPHVVFDARQAVGVTNLLGYMPDDCSPVSEGHEPNILHGQAHLQGTLLAIVSERQALSAPAIAAA